MHGNVKKKTIFY